MMVILVFLGWEICIWLLLVEDVMASIQFIFCIKDKSIEEKKYKNVSIKKNKYTSGIVKYIIQAHNLVKVRKRWKKACVSR